MDARPSSRRSSGTTSSRRTAIGASRAAGRRRDRARYARLDAPRIGRTTCVGPRRLPAAANLLDRAARLLGERDAERPRLLVSAGEAYLEIGEFSKADEILIQARADAATIAEHQLAITADLVRLQLHLRSEASTSIDDVMRQTHAVGDLEAYNDANGLARAWRLLELANGVSGRYKAAGDANAKAIEYARTRRGPGPRDATPCLVGAGASVGADAGTGGIVRCEELIRMGEGNRQAGIAGLAHLRAMVGDFERARDDYRRGRAILEELGLRFDASTISIDSGGGVARRRSTAEAELRKDYEALDAMGERTTSRRSLGSSPRRCTARIASRRQLTMRL